MKHVLITGTNSGIGEATSELLLGKGYHVFGSVRDDQAAERLASRFGASFTPLVFDVTDEAAIQRSVSLVESKLGRHGLTALVNNAGMVAAGALKDLPVAEFKKQIDVNLVGAFAVTRAFLPLLGADKNGTIRPGRIINISSLAGRRTYPFLVAYAASKHGMEALTDGLRMELALYGIEVIGILPGTVDTALIAKMNSGLTAASANSDYAPMFARLKEVNDEAARHGIPIARVVAAIAEAIESPRPRTRYVLRTSFVTDFLIPKVLPTRLLDRMVASTLGIKR